jgi:predicted DNA binding CopG/RHH family protein
VYRDYRNQDTHVSFRTNDALVTALNDRARQAGCSTSEYLRSLIRERVGL